jgi:hypothetical protein
LPAIVPLGAFWLLRLAERAWELSGARCLRVRCDRRLRVTFFIFMRPVSYEFIERRAMSKEYRHRLEQVPLDAIMISGAQTIAVHYWASIGEGVGRRLERAAVGRAISCFR